MWLAAVAIHATCLQDQKVWGEILVVGLHCVQLNFSTRGSGTDCVAVRCAGAATKAGPQFSRRVGGRPFLPLHDRNVELNVESGSALLEVSRNV